MSYLGDAFKFELFNLKDMWGKLKDNPERAFIGAIDPISSKLWGKVLNKDYEPIVDQLGGPYGGHTISAFGNKDGGVYERAEAAGVPTNAAGNLHDVAHVVAAMYGTAGLGNAASGMFGGAGGAGGSQPGLWNQGFTGAGGFGGSNPGSVQAVQNSPWIINEAGAMGSAAPASGATGTNYARLGMQAMSGMQPQGQQQQPPPQAPVRNMAQPSQVPTIGQRISGGFGRVGQALFPGDPNSGLSPEQQEALRRQAIMRMGLGMMSASNQGAGFGQALAAGFGQASTDMRGAMQRSYENAMRNRAEVRAERREDRDDARAVRDEARADREQAHQQWLLEHTLKREQVADDRYATDRDYRVEQDKLAQDRWRSEQDAMAKWRSDQIAARTQGDVPAGYRLRQDGNLEAIPGGPADPSGLAARKGAQALRKEFRGLPSVKEYESVLPIIQAAKSSPDTPQGDLAMIYAVGKILDPDSVVREGELVLTQNAAPWIQKMIGQARSQLGQGGRLTPEMRAGLIDMLDQRVAASRQAYDRDFQQYSEYAREASLNPELVVGAMHENTGRGLGQAAPRVTKQIGGRTYVQINGQWYEDDGTAPGQ
jgi:hypothetical protein